MKKKTVAIIIGFGVALAGVICYLMAENKRLKMYQEWDDDYEDEEDLEMYDHDLDDLDDEPETSSVSSLEEDTCEELPVEELLKKQ